MIVMMSWTCCNNNTTRLLVGRIFMPFLLVFSSSCLPARGPVCAGWHRYMNTSWNTILQEPAMGAFIAVVVAAPCSNSTFRRDTSHAERGKRAIEATTTSSATDIWNQRRRRRKTTKKQRTKGIFILAWIRLGIKTDTNPLVDEWRSSITLGYSFDFLMMPLCASDFISLFLPLFSAFIFILFYFLQRYYYSVWWEGNEAISSSFSAPIPLSIYSWKKRTAANENSFFITKSKIYQSRGPLKSFSTITHKKGKKKEGKGKWKD